MKKKSLKMLFALTYEESINTLNNFPSNATAISQSITSKLIVKKHKRDSILKYLSFTGYTKDDLHQLSVIHIAGTKGKGSTSALCESILRSHGYKTGLYSSPHLISVTERIRLNGKPIEKEHFAKVFSKIYKDICEKQESENDFPPYFGFMTVMAFNVFIAEKVDVAIVEVGIGGEYDQTNVVSNVPVVGITSLGLDHTALLGNTIEEIARQKAGIMKPGCKAFTVQQQPNAMKVLREMSKIRKCTLNIVPDYETYKWEHDPDEKNVRLANPTKYLNASLAIQLAHSWIKQNKKINFDSNILNEYYKPKVEVNGNIKDDMLIYIPKKTLDGIHSSFWPGRCQILNEENRDIYIDGAHTIESMEVCTEWFKKECRDDSYKILIFHVTKGRNPKPMMEIISKLNFNMALFVPDQAFNEIKSKTPIDQMDVNNTIVDKLSTCKNQALTWMELNNQKDSTQRDKTVIDVFSDVSTALEYVSSYCSKQKPQILITGSLLLAGAALTVLDPQLIKSHEVTSSRKHNLAM